MTCYLTSLKSTHSENKINTRPQPIPQRNDACLCGSGKKYKKCCLSRQAVSVNLPENTCQGYLDAAQQAVLKKDFSLAEKFFANALRHKKNSALALAGRGQCLCQLNRPNEGIPFLYQAGKVLLKEARQTGKIHYLLDLGYQLVCWHAPKEALMLATATLAIDANSASACHTAALSLQALNKHAEAYSYARRAVELAPLESNAIIQLAVLEGKLGQLDEARRRLEMLVDQKGDPNAARTHLELGVILDKAGEFDLAFKYLTEYGEISLDSPAVRWIDKKAVYREINQYRESFSAQFLQLSANVVAYDGLPSPVFLLGFYRSGTTLAEQILSAHTEVVSSEETHLITEVLNELSKITATAMTLPERIKSLGSVEIAHLRKHYWQTAKHILGQQVMHKVLIDKTALNTINIELINTIFPNSVTIFAVRDPRDVCLSCFMQPFSLSPLTVNFLDWTDSARFYALIMDYWLSIRDSLSLQWLELRYEDVLDDLEGQFRPIFVKMGLEWSDECSDFYRHSQRKIIKTPSFDQVTKPLYQSSVDRWRNYTDHFASILPILEPYIKTFGYDLM